MLRESASSYKDNKVYKEMQRKKGKKLNNCRESGDNESDMNKAKKIYNLRGAFKATLRRGEIKLKEGYRKRKGERLQR